MGPINRRLCDFDDKMFAENLPNETEHGLSSDEIDESSNAKHCESKLMLDYESFIIFSRISMDRL
jgi:hypothetical protein